jgi:hypothetical protein
MPLYHEFVIILELRSAAKTSSFKFWFHLAQFQWFQRRLKYEKYTHNDMTDGQNNDRQQMTQRYSLFMSVELNTSNQREITPNNYIIFL